MDIPREAQQRLSLALAVGDKWWRDLLLQLYGCEDSFWLVFQEFMDANSDEEGGACSTPEEMLSPHFFTFH